MRLAGWARPKLEERRVRNTALGAHGRSGRCARRRAEPVRLPCYTSLAPAVTSYCCEVRLLVRVVQNYTEVALGASSSLQPKLSSFERNCVVAPRAVRVCAGFVLSSHQLLVGQASCPSVE